MKISFILPVYNVEKYLSQCLESLVKQTYQDIEIIAVNDGSTDTSPQILVKYASVDKRIRILNQKNQGLSMARNVGLENVTGEYVLFVDSDDYVALNTAECIAKVVEQFPQLDVVTFSREIFYENAYSLVDDLFVSSGNIFSGKEFFERAISERKFVSAVWQKAFSMKFLIQNNLMFIPNILYEDLSFSIHAILYAQQVTSISDVLYFYRRSNLQSITNNVSSRDLDVLKTLEYFQKLLENRDTSDILKSEVWHIFMFKWVANAIFFKYPKIAFWNTVGWKNCRKIKSHPIFRSYLETVTHLTSNRNLQIAAILIKWNLPCFYVVRKISKIIFPNYKF